MRSFISLFIFAVVSIAFFTTALVYRSESMGLFMENPKGDTRVQRAPAVDPADRKYIDTVQYREAYPESAHDSR